MVYRCGSAQGTQIADADERVRFAQEEFNLNLDVGFESGARIREGHPQVAFFYDIQVNYEIRRRRSMPAAPRIPVPSNIKLDGSGTGEVE